MAKKLGIIGFPLIALLTLTFVSIGFCQDSSQTITSIVDLDRLEAEEQKLKRTESALLEKVQEAAASSSSGGGSVGQINSVKNDNQQPVAALDNIKVLVEQYEGALEKLAKQDQVIADLNAKNSSLELQLSKIQAETSVLASSKSILETQANELKLLSSTNTKMNSDLTKCAASSQRLRSDLDKARRQLMLAETEVQRLSAILQTKNNRTLASLGGATPNAQLIKTSSTLNDGNPNNRVVVKGRNLMSNQVESAEAPEELPIATVTSAKANLRTGPGENNSPLMAVSAGTRLVVETRRGEWLRVVTPTGTRAWISSSVVDLNRNNQPEINESQITSYNSTAEDAAFKLLKTNRTK